MGPWKRPTEPRPMPVPWGRTRPPPRGLVTKPPLSRCRAGPKRRLMVRTPRWRQMRALTPRGTRRPPTLRGTRRPPTLRGTPDADSGGPGKSRSTGLRRLEEEGEVAADYLEELLDIADVDGDIDIDVENSRASVAVVADAGSDRALRRLVGGKGEVLEALQELTRLAVQASTGERSRLMLDVAGYRAGRRRALEDVAARACQDVNRTGEPSRLEPMSAFERKVVHDVVADAGLVSESEGQDPNRRVVIMPASS